MNEECDGLNIENLGGGYTGVHATVISTCKFL